MKAWSLIAILLISLACTKKDSARENSLNWALSSALSTIDPALCYDTVSSKVVYQVYETLYEYEYLVRPYQLKPLLAEDMPLVTDEGKTYKIKIKDGIYFHDSTHFGGKRRKLKAQDFINQIKRVAYVPTQSTGWWMFDNKVIGLNEFREKAKTLEDFFKLDVPGLQAPDDQTLIIKLKEPYPQLQYVLAMAFSTPMPEEVIKGTKNELDASNTMIGTGPYQLVERNHGLNIKLKKFKNYHTQTYPANGDRISYEKKLLTDRGKELPFIDRINFHIIKEDQTRWLKFMNKEIDAIVLRKDQIPIAIGPSGQLKEEFQGQGIELQVAPTLTYWWLAFNMKHPIIGKNLKLRQAIAHAVNIDEYIQKFTHNISLKANSIYPPGVFGYSPSNILPYDYNPAKAKKLLAEAGYPEGKGLPEFNYDVRGSSTVSRQMGEYIQKELESIGIKLKLNINTFPGFLNKARTGQLEIWQGGWQMDYPDPENVIQLFITKNHSPGPNSTFYSNKEVDKLYQELFSVKNEAEVKEITSKVQKIVNKDLPWVMQFYTRNYILHHTYVKNFRQSDLINNNFKYLRISTKN
ncbi:MAG: hypothetical protein CME62_02535 [Halobacteriovoraceae bacterium]|nr:hypothetical protein [Halobacteriovoraceae bacterium]|tara:strand:- start:4400 stop:6130 length:1731 start_codon:yes stop_codon:yes gene_type:complete